MNKMEIDKIEIVRELCQDLPNNLTDFDILRWLHQWNNNVDIVVPNLRHTIKMLNSLDIKNYNNSNQVLEKYWPGGMLGTTGKDNNFVYIESLGLMDYGGLFKIGSMSQLLRTRIKYHESNMELIRKRERETGRMSQIVHILDVQNVKFDKHLISFVIGHYKSYGDFFTNNYGDVHKKFIAVNVPKNAAHIFRLLKPFIPEKARQKIVILHDNWKEKLLEHVAQECLPVYWGGSMVDENNDPMCRSKIVVPTQKIPESCYWSFGENDFDKSQLTHLIVRPRKAEFITVPIENEGTELEWYFVTGSRFAFGVYFTEYEDECNVDNLDVVFPDLCTYASATIVPECERIVCNRIGYYKLRFDNHFSWFHSLDVYYKIRLFA